MSRQEWGRMSSLYMMSQWSMVLAVLTYRGSCLSNLHELLPLATETLSVVLEEEATVVLQCLALIISKV